MMWKILQINLYGSYFASKYIFAYAITTHLKLQGPVCKIKKKDRHEFRTWKMRLFPYFPWNILFLSEFFVFCILSKYITSITNVRQRKVVLRCIILNTVHLLIGYQSRPKFVIKIVVYQNWLGGTWYLHVGKMRLLLFA